MKIIRSLFVFLLLTVCFTGLVSAQAFSVGLRISGILPQGVRGKLVGIRLDDQTLVLELEAGKEQKKITVDPWPVFLSLPLCEDCQVKGDVRFQPDGPIQLLQLWQDKKIIMAIGRQTRSKGEILPGWHLAAGKKINAGPEKNIFWAKAKLIGKNARYAIFPGKLYRFSLSGDPWQFYLSAARKFISSNTPVSDQTKSPQRMHGTPEIAHETPLFSADWILIRN